MAAFKNIPQVPTLHNTNAVSSSHLSRYVYEREAESSRASLRRSVKNDTKIAETFPEGINEFINF
jgi:hypothetical protein